MNQTMIYNYDPVSLRYVGSASADLSPLESGVILVPAHATLIEPPEHGEDDLCTFTPLGTWALDFGYFARQRQEATAARQVAENDPQVVQRRLAAAVQSHLDVTAQAWGYTNMAYAVSYADEPAVPQFAAEGAALRAWRSLVWAGCYWVMAQVKDGSRAVPTEAELLSLLPTVTRPA
jgi:hypothetical protein